MIHLKRKRSSDRKIGQKVFLALVLLILLWSRILSSVATIQEVQASFPTQNTRGEIQAPTVEVSDEPIEIHMQMQSKVSGQKDVPLQEMTEKSRRSRRIRDFYARWNAPMGANAEDIVESSEKWGLDWRLIPAISIVESSGGRHCFRPYNAYGWGSSSYGSFEESIEDVARGLSTGYGTDNPYAIAPRYNPVTPNAWANKVAGLMSQI